jgi:signal peptidase I
MDTAIAFLAAFAMKFFVAEAFTVPTNSMAPTILGRHWEAPCPRCRGIAYATPEQDSFNHPILMICGKDRHSCEVASPPHATHSGDRFLVNKWLSPRRWDIVVFRYPEDPRILYCKRVVGLPGETITIGNGAIWCNGKKQTPPDSCKGIEYLDHIEGWPGDLWGSEAKPARLGADEYFVLGDFSARAKDSRLWQEGAPGHPPYAVPKSYFVGVAEFIYWPPSRMAWLR